LSEFSELKKGCVPFFSYYLPGGSVKRALLEPSLMILRKSIKLLPQVKLVAILLSIATCHSNTALKKIKVVVAAELTAKAPER
jgi:hypothetical protein